MLKKYFLLIIIIFSFASCTNIKKVQEQNKTISKKNIYIKVASNSKYDTALIDTNLAHTINGFNSYSSKAHFIYVKDTFERDNTITINILKQDFASSQKMTINYVVNTIGIVALPIYTLIVTKNKFGFLYIPAYDKVFFKPTYSNWKLNNRLYLSKVRSLSYAFFKNREKRNNQMIKAFNEDVARFLIRIEEIVSNPYFLEK